VATGSEVHLSLAAAQRLAESGTAARVVSLPSWDRFAAQSREFRNSVLPSSTPTLSIEAATTFGWERYADECIGIDRFGASAPGPVVMERLGINIDNVVATATRLVQGSNS
jgi:transketolase